MNLLRRLAALLVVVSGTVGAPIGLWIFGRSLIPTQAPSAGEVWAALTSPDNGRLLATALLLVGVIAWLVFLTSVLVDVAARVRHRPPVRIPGLRAPQTVAGTLVGIILLGSLTLGSPAAAGPLPALPHSTASSSAAAATAPALHPAAARGVLVDSGRVDQSPIQVPAAAPEPVATPAAASPASARWVVARGDTLWEIAKSSLGDPLRYPEISALNVGRVQADGQVMRDDDWLRPGWVLTLPSDATAPTAEDHGGPAAPVEVLVDGGDTLSEIAAEHGSTVAAVWEANQGRTEPGGQLVDPDLIYPGWTITVPGDTSMASGATVAAAAQPVTPTDSTDASTPPTPVGTDASPTPAPAPNPAPTPAPAVTSSDAPATAPVTPPASPVTPTAAAPATVSAATDSAATATSAAGGLMVPADAATVGVTGSGRPVDSGSEDSDWSQALAAAGAALLAGGLFATLRRLRRSQHRRRRPGHVFATTDPSLLGWERTIDVAGRAGYVDLVFVDTTLRDLAAGCAAADLALPEVAAARLSPTGLELLLARPATDAPAPWSPCPEGLRWQLERPALPADPPTVPVLDRRPVPYPTLVSVGHDGADRWLVDLEQMATGRLVGDPQRCRDLARFIAAELSHNPWAQLTRITVIGWGAELADLAPGRLVITDQPGHALAAAAAQLRETREAPMGPLQGRRDEVTLDAWTPHVLLIDPATTFGAGLPDVTDMAAATAAAGGRSTVALLITGAADGADDADDAAAGWRIEVDADGALRIPAWGISGTAEQLTGDAARQVGEFLRSTDQAVSGPAPASGGDRSWEEHCDTMGSLLTADGVSRDRDQPVVQLAGGEQLSSLLTLPASAYAATSAVPAESLGVLAPMVAPRARARIEGADRDLDGDVAAWYDPACTRLKVALLGPVEVRAHGPLPGDRPREAFYTEIVAYLVTRSRGATVAEFARALWPEDPEILTEDGKAKPKVRKAISVTRQWIGQDPDTQRNYLPLQPGVKDAVYRVDGALVDADLMRRLRVRGSARGGDAGIADLAAAHRLCQGTPLDRRRSGGYSWAIDANLSDLTDHFLRSVTDIGHVLAAHHLQRGEPQAAVEVCQRSLLAGAVDPTSRCNLVRAYRDLGDAAAAERQVQYLVDSYDVEDEVTLPPDVFAMLYGDAWRVS